MDTNKHGVSVPNDLCAICAEAKALVDYDEHSRHVDFIAARARAHGWHTPAPPGEQLAAEFERANPGKQR
jgi:hypothetical protein